MKSSHAAHADLSSCVAQKARALFAQCAHYACCGATYSLPNALRKARATLLPKRSFSASGATQSTVRYASSCRSKHRTNPRKPASLLAYMRQQRIAITFRTWRTARHVDARAASIGSLATAHAKNFLLALVDSAITRD
jgi:hypothetical protein